MPYDSASELPIEAIVIDKVLEILGTTGEHWIQNSYRKRGNFCIRGAVMRARTQLGIKRDKTEKLLAARLQSTIDTPQPKRCLIEGFNDAKGRRFDEVRDLLLNVRHEIVGLSR